MFNTGDIGRWRDDGTLEHLGRADDQVKIKVSARRHTSMQGSLKRHLSKGFRVELDGVSAAMEVSTSRDKSSISAAAQDTSDVQWRCSRHRPAHWHRAVGLLRTSQRQRKGGRDCDVACSALLRCANAVHAS